jgi:hypothetical protein
LKRASGRCLFECDSFADGVLVAIDEGALSPLADVSASRVPLE